MPPTEPYETLHGPRGKRILVREEVTAPHSEDAERGVLGAVIVEPSVLDPVLEMLQPEDFYRYHHQLLFAAYRVLRERRLGIDLITLRDHLAATGQLEDVGGAAYIASLTDGVPRSTNWEHYASIVRTCRVDRDMLQVSHRILAEIMTGDLRGSALAHAVDGWVLDVTNARATGELRPQSYLVPLFVKDFMARHDSKGAMTGIDTGLTALNEYTRGLHRGDYGLLAARTSTGKTAMVLNWAKTAARAGHKVGIFSLEMDKLQLQYRLVSSMSGVRLFKMLNGWCSDRELQACALAFNELDALPLHIDDTPLLNPLEFRGRCRRMKAQVGLDLVIVDYIQLMEATPGLRVTSRNEALTDISRKLKIFAKELNISLVALSQLKRAEPGKEHIPPGLHDLRDSGALEQDADWVLFIHRTGDAINGPAQLLLRKHRNGPVGEMEVTFDKETVTFHNATDPEKEPTAPTESESPTQGRLPSAPAGRAGRHR